MKNTKSTLLSPYPLKWFYFCMYFRYPLGALINLSHLSDYLNNLSTFPFLYGVEILYTSAIIFLTIFAIVQGCRFSPKGLKLIYAMHICNIIYSLITIVLLLIMFMLFTLTSSIDIGFLTSSFTNSVVLIIFSVLELIYYRKRKSLFIHSDNTIRVKYKYVFETKSLEDEMQAIEQPEYGNIKENMPQKKETFTYEAYIKHIAYIAERCYKKSEKLFSNASITHKDELLQALDYTRLFFAADLYAAWLCIGDCSRAEFQKKLFAHFYKTYPEDFLSDLQDSIKSDETKLGDVCNFLVDSFSNEGAISKIYLLELIRSDLTPSLKLFSSAFRATTLREDGMYVINCSKMCQYAQQA